MFLGLVAGQAASVCPAPTRIGQVGVMTSCPALGLFVREEGVTASILQTLLLSSPVSVRAQFTAPRAPIAPRAPRTPRVPRAHLRKGQ